MLVFLSVYNNMRFEKHKSFMIINTSHRNHLNGTIESLDPKILCFLPFSGYISFRYIIENFLSPSPSLPLSFAPFHSLSVLHFVSFLFSEDVIITTMLFFFDSFLYHLVRVEIWSQRHLIIRTFIPKKKKKTEKPHKYCFFKEFSSTLQSRKVQKKKQNRMN